MKRQAKDCCGAPVSDRGVSRTLEVEMATESDGSIRQADGAPGASWARSAHGRTRWPAIMLIALIAVAGGFLQGCGGASSSASTNLSGRWASNGYTCPPDAPHRETVTIVQNGGHLVATKIVGDDCVHGGHVSFLGRIEGKAGRVGFWAAPKGGTPSLGQQVQPLQIAGANRFSVTFPGVGLMKFTRIGTANGSGGSDWWPWVIVVLLLLMFTAVLIRRRRRPSDAR
jgi:hypothetical protein